MAQPRQPEQHRVQRPSVQHEEVEQRVSPHTEPKDETPPVSEEMALVALFGEMVKKVDEIYQVALGLESSVELAKLLGEVGIVRVTLTEMMGKMKEAEDMRIAEERLMAERAHEREVE